MAQRQTIFVLGADPFHTDLLESLRGAESLEFRPLLTYDAVVHPADDFSFTDLLERAERELAAHSGSVGGVLGYWDFPSTCLAAVLNRRHDIPSARLDAVAKCEHKYWARLEQQTVVPDMVPRFALVDPFAEDPLAGADIDYPFWIKPVKAHSSYLGFRIESRADLDAHLPAIRANIAHFGNPFDEFLSLVEPPSDLPKAGGNTCIAEEIVSLRRQCTLEGYVQDGRVVVYGIVESLRSGRFLSSFESYRYPAGLDETLRETMVAVADAVMTRVGYDNAPFNMEFFFDETAGVVRLLEVNARISKSHSPLFQMVDGVSHQQVAVDLLLGRSPLLPYREGRFAVAAKFMIRTYTDGVIRRVPDAAEIRRLQEEFPEAGLRLHVKPGMRLAHLPYQDSYSFELAELFLGAADDRELDRKYCRARELLTFEIDALDQVSA